MIHCGTRGASRGPGALGPRGLAGTDHNEADWCPQNHDNFHIFII